MGGTGAMTGYAALAAAAGQGAVHCAGDSMDRGVILMAIEALALRPLRMGEHGGRRKHKCAAQKVKSTAVSAHFFIIAPP